MSKKELKKGNLKFSLIGVGIMILGLIITSLVGPNYHGILGLLAVSTILLGTVTVFWGLIADVE